VIVLDHRRIPQAHAVVGGTTHARCIFLEHAQAGDRLACVKQRAPRARKGALPSPLGPLPAEPAIMVLELSAAQLAPPVPRAPAAAWALAV
jgi:hypothetical protein